MSDIPETNAVKPKFDFAAFPEDTFFYDRRSGLERRGPRPTAIGPEPQRRAKKERRRRIDPTTFEKQYTKDEIEFMTAMQEFKIRSGKAFPTYTEVLRVAQEIGYRRVIGEPDDPEAGDFEGDDLSLDLDEAESAERASIPITFPFAATAQAN